MSVFDTRPEKRIASEHVSDRPTYIGTDETGAVHYWSIHDRTVIVVEGDDTATCDLSDSDRPLGHWSEHTAAERGWADCTISADPLFAGGL